MKVTQKFLKMGAVEQGVSGEREAESWGGEFAVEMGV